MGQIVASDRVVVVGTTPVMLVGFSPHRTTLRFSAPSGGRVTVAPRRQPVLDQGETIQPGDQPHTYRQVDDG